MKVVIAVRWLHSLVTSMMPTTGSRTEETKRGRATKSPNAAASSCATTTHKKIVSASRASPTVIPISQRPARVSTVLRSSTAKSRPNGMPGVAETSKVLVRVLT